MSTTLYGYPTGTSTHEWTPTSGGTNHALLLDENPPNETDYISVNSFSGNKADRFTMDPGTTNTFIKVTSYDVELHLYGVAGTNVPGIGISLYLNGSLLGSQIFACETEGDWGDFVCTFSPLSVNQAEWYAGPIEVVVTAYNGSAGYKPLPPIPVVP